MLSSKVNLLIFLLLMFGLISRLTLSNHGNFLFNMDSARDMIDLREIILLKQPRLIGPITGGIEGFFYGPLWYYMILIPFSISSGDPHSVIVFETVLWVIGGWFLLKLASKWGFSVTTVTGILWIASNLVLLTNQFALNPNPIILLTPVFLYFFLLFLKEGQIKYLLVSSILAASFINFEIAVGFFMPIVMILGCLITNKKLLSVKNILVIVIIFSLSLLPQIIFDFRHNHLLFNAMLSHFRTAQHQTSWTFRFNNIGLTYWNVYLSLVMNSKLIFFLSFFSISLTIGSLVKQKSLMRQPIIVICMLINLIPLVGFIFLPIEIKLWHLGSSTSLFLVLGFSLFYLKKKNWALKVLSYSLSMLLIFTSFQNLRAYFKETAYSDPSLIKNEIAAIDYTYQYSKGQDFKVYAYLPSVIDYPYQYLYWWYGQSQYHYLPLDYAYLPDKPVYIRNKDKFSSHNTNAKSKLVFLIKEPDDLLRRELWENNFNQLTLKDKTKIGPLEIEVREEIVN